MGDAAYLRKIQAGRSTLLLAGGSALHWRFGMASRHYLRCPPPSQVADTERAPQRVRGWRTRTGAGAARGYMHILRGRAAAPLPRRRELLDSPTGVLLGRSAALPSAVPRWYDVAARPLGAEGCGRRRRDAEAAVPGEFLSLPGRRFDDRWLSLRWTYARLCVACCPQILSVSPARPSRLWLRRCVRRGAVCPFSGQFAVGMILRYVFASICVVGCVCVAVRAAGALCLP